MGIVRASHQELSLARSLGPLFRATLLPATPAGKQRTWAVWSPVVWIGWGMVVLILCHGVESRVVG